MFTGALPCRNLVVLVLVLCYGRLSTGLGDVQGGRSLEREIAHGTGDDGGLNNPTTVAILVHCRRKGFEARDTIRQTWASQLPLGTSVAFVVGAQGCAVEVSTFD